MPLEYERADFVMCLFRDVIFRVLSREHALVNCTWAGSVIDRYKTSDAVWSFRVSKRRLDFASSSEEGRVRDS
jgi:hypothetical protein